MANTIQIIPVAKMGKSLTVAMADPLNIFAIDDLKSLTGFEITPSSPSRIGDPPDDRSVL